MIFCVEEYILLKVNAGAQPAYSMPEGSAMEFGVLLSTFSLIGCSIGHEVRLEVFLRPFASTLSCSVLILVRAF